MVGREDVNNIKEEIITISMTYYALDQAIGSLALKDQIILRYAQHVLTQLSEIFKDDNPDIIDQCEEFLTSNWALVKGNVLCYTALHNNDITGLICRIAKFLSTTKEPSKPPIAYLMPTISLMPLLDDDKYPELDKIDLSLVLRTHIVGEGNHLIPIKQLINFDTFLSPEPVFHLYFDVFGRNRDGEDKFDESEVTRLLSHSPLTRKISDLIREKDELVTRGSNLYSRLILLCHQLWVNSANVIGSEERAGEGIYREIESFRTYYEKLDAGQKEKIPSAVRDEWKILDDFFLGVSKLPRIQSCIATRRTMLLGSIKPYKAVLSDISLSDDNIARETHRIEAELKKAKDTLCLMIDNQEYQGLDGLFLRLSLLNEFDVDLTINTFDSISFLYELEPDEITLFCGEASNKSALLEAVSNINDLTILSMSFTASKLRAFFESLGSEIVNRYLHHVDNLAWVLNVLDDDKCKIICRSIESVIAPKLDVACVSSILKSLTDGKRSIVLEMFLERVIENSNSFDDLKPLFLLMSDPQQRVSVYSSAKSRLKEIINSADEFNALLMILPTVVYEEVYVFFDDKLLELIISDKSFSSVLSLAAESRFDHIWPRITDEFLKGLVGSAADVPLLLKDMTASATKKILEKLLSVMPGLIDTMPIMQSIVNQLRPEQVGILFEVLGDDLEKIILDMSALRSLLNASYPSICSAVFKHSYKKILQNPMSIKALNALFGSLCRNARHAVWSVLNDSPDSVFITVEDADQLRRFMKMLHSSDRDQVISFFGRKIATTVNSIDDFVAVQIVDPYVFRVNFYGPLKDKLPAFVDSLDDIVRVVPHLGGKQETIEFVDAVNSRRPELVCTADHYAKVFSALYYDSTKIGLYQHWKEELVDKARSLSGYTSLMPVLLEAQAIELIGLVKDDLKNQVLSISDFSLIFSSSRRTDGRSFGRASRKKIFNILKSKLPVMIDSARSLISLLEILNIDEMYTVFSLLREKLEHLKLNVHSLNAVAVSLESRRRRSVFYDFLYESSQNAYDPFAVEEKYILSGPQKKALKNLDNGALVESIETIGFFRYMASCVKGGLRKNFFLAAMDKIIALTTSASDLAHVACFIPQSFLDDFLSEERLGLIQSFEDFTLLMSVIPISVHNTVIEVLKDRLARMISSSQDFRQALLYSDRATCTDLYKACKSEFNNYIQTGEDLYNISCYLLPPQREEVLAEVSGGLIDLVKSTDDYAFLLDCLPRDKQDELNDSMKVNVQAIKLIVKSFMEGVVVNVSTSSKQQALMVMLSDLEAVNDYEALVSALNDFVARTSVHEHLFRHFKFFKEYSDAPASASAMLAALNNEPVYQLLKYVLGVAEGEEVESVDALSKHSR